MDYIAREDALVLLKRYNQDPFHIQHALTVEAVMKWYARRTWDMAPKTQNTGVS